MNAASSSFLLQWRGRERQQRGKTFRGSCGACRPHPCPHRAYRRDEEHGRRGGGRGRGECGWPMTLRGNGGTRGGFFPFFRVVVRTRGRTFDGRRMWTKDPGGGGGGGKGGAGVVRGVTTSRGGRQCCPLPLCITIVFVAVVMGAAYPFSSLGGGDDPSTTTATKRGFPSIARARRGGGGGGGGVQVSRVFTGIQRRHRREAFFIPERRTKWG